MSICNKERADDHKRILPKFLQDCINLEENDWKQSILTDIPKVIQSKDYEFISMCFSNLGNYLDMPTFSLTPKEVETIAQHLNNFIITTSDMNLLQAACELFASFVNPQYIKITLDIDWKPLYQLLYDVNLSHSKTRTRKFPPKLTQALISMIRISRNFFSETATDEILSQWSHMLDPRQPSFTLGQCLLSLFLPVHHGQHHKWLQTVLDLWTLFRSDHFDFQFLSLLARLSRYGYKDIQWDKIIPFLFNMIGLDLGIPTTLLPSQINPINDYHPDLYPDFFKDLESTLTNFRLFAIIIINLLTGETKEMARDYSARLFHLIAPFCTASLRSEDEEQCEGPIELLNEYVGQYISRYQKEKKYTPILEPLTQEDNDWLVSQILPLILMEQFHEDPQFSCLMDVVQLSPSTTIYPLLQAVEVTFEHIHLKQGAYQTLVALAPTIIYTKEGLPEFMTILERHFHEDLNFMDTTKSSMVFSLGTIVASSMGFTEDNEPFINQIVEQCLVFLQHASGDDYLPSFAEMITMLGSIIRASPPKVVHRLSQLIKDQLDKLPENLVRAVIEPLGVFAIKTFSQNALHPTTLRDYFILESIIKQNEVFLFENIDKIQTIIQEALVNDNEKIKKRAKHLIKWTLRNLCSVYPVVPTTSGITSYKDSHQEWHVPSEQEIEASQKFLRNAIDILKNLQRKSRKEFKLAAKVAKSILKGIQPSLNDEDFEHETEKFVQPRLKIYSIPSFVKPYEEVIDILYEMVTDPNIHSEILQYIVQTFIETAVPGDPIGRNVDSFINEYRIYCQLSRLSTLLPPRESITHLVIYSKAILLYFSRTAIKKSNVTTMLRKMTEKIYQLIPNNYEHVRELILVFFASLTHQFKTQFLEYFHRSIPIIADPKTDPIALSSHCAVLQAIRNLNVNIDSLRIIADASLAVCRVLPTDVPEDSARQLRQAIAVFLDSLDPCDPRIATPEYLKLRYELATEAIRRHATFPASRETQNYADAIVCSSVIGNPYLLQAEYFNFLISILPSDDNVVRDCLVQMLPGIIETLIPRVPRPYGVEVEEVTPENYDVARFIDRPFKDQSKKMPLFLTETELQDPQILKQYFDENDDDILERIKIHQLLFKKLCHEHSVINKFIDLLIDGQVHKEETFYKARVLFWSTLCRFLGPIFINSLIEKLYPLIKPGVSLAHHVIAAEIFAGCIHSIKGRKYLDVEKVSESVKPFVTQLIQTIDPEYHSVWHYSFYTSFTDIDPRRIFWLYDHILSCVPKGDGLRTARSVSLICDILLDAAYKIKSLRPKIEEIAAIPLFSKESLQFEQIRECSIRALTSILSISFDPVTRGYNKESIQTIEKFVSNSSEHFILRWVFGQFSTQSVGALASGGYVIDHLHEWVDFILDKDEKEERIARAALMSAATSNWLGSICELPISIDSVYKMIEKMLHVLDPDKKQWQVQTVQLLFTESFLGSTFFFLDEAILESMITDRIIPGLLDQHPDVQDAASQLLTFVVKSSSVIKDKLPFIVERFIAMLTDKESLSRRIAGAKGLSSIIMGTLLFDEVPQYITDSFQALTDAVEVDSSVENIISQFFSDFWALYDNNLMQNIAETLAPYHDSLRPSYFC